jgi:hypothetical protein
VDTADVDRFFRDGKLRYGAVKMVPVSVSAFGKEERGSKLRLEGPELRDGFGRVLAACDLLVEVTTDGGNVIDGTVSLIPGAYRRGGGSQWFFGVDSKGVGAQGAEYVITWYLIPSRRGERIEAWDSRPIVVTEDGGLELKAAAM